MVQKIVLSLVVLGFISTLSASETKENIVVMGETTLLKQALSKMTIRELEESVEACAENGTMPFEMGVELIKRWTEKNS